MSIIPRPASPKRAWADLRDYFAEGRRHKVLFLLLAVAMTWVIIWGFLLDSKTNTAPGRKIIYIQNWTEDRTDAEIIAQQKIDVLRRQAAIKGRQEDFRKVADQFGIDWRREAKIGDAREKEAVAELMAHLDKLEAKARAKEKAEPTASPAPVAAQGREAAP